MSLLTKSAQQLLLGVSIQLPKGSILIAGLALTTLLSGCASSSKLPCATTDWYELGRQQGATGQEKSAPRTIASNCKAEGDQLDAQALFESGHSLGLSEYCSETNGYQLAKMNHEYKIGTCPQLLEEAFLRGYRSGQDAVRLSRDRKSIRNKIQRIEGNLQKTNMHFARRGLLKAERIVLLEEFSEIDRQLARHKDVDIASTTETSFFAK